MKTPATARRFALLTIAFVIQQSSLAVAQSTINATNKYAYGANTGWINVRPSAADGVIVGEAYLSGHAYGANIGWINFGDGSPVNGHTYANANAADCGVNHDGTGNLTGFAYGANIGWINFGWAAGNDPNRPRFDLSSGSFLGYAYSANTGWVNLGTGDLVTDAMVCPDTDFDNISDAWEFQKFGNLSLAAIGTDKDGDGQTDAAEYAADTDPDSAGDYLRIVSQSYNTGLTEVTLQFATTRPTRIYHLESSTTLLSTGSGAWTTIGTTFFADPGTTTTKVVSFVASDARFFRAVASRPLQ